MGSVSAPYTQKKVKGGSYKVPTNYRHLWLWSSSDSDIPKEEPNQTGRPKMLSNQKPQCFEACCLTEFAYLT